MGVGMAVLCDRLVCPQETRLGARSMQSLSGTVGGTNFVNLMGNWAPSCACLPARHHTAWMQTGTIPTSAQ